MNTQFDKHVRSTAFSLTLSAAMIDMLVFVSNCDNDSMVRSSRFIQHLDALKRRGLVTHDADRKETWQITKAGSLLLELLSETQLLE